jgi:hypothetical protein
VPCPASLGSAQPQTQPVELVGEQGEGDPEDCAGHLGSRIQTTLDLYTDEDLGEMIAAQEKFLDAVGFEAGNAQANGVDEIVGKLKRNHSLLTA